MAKRTPTLQATPQNQNYWGVFPYTVGAGLWADGSNMLPGAPGNPLSASDFQVIEVGDLATTSAVSIADRGTWVCVDVPTASGTERQPSHGTRSRPGTTRARRCH